MMGLLGLRPLHSSLEMTMGVARLLITVMTQPFRGGGYWFPTQAVTSTENR